MALASIDNQHNLNVLAQYQVDVGKAISNVTSTQLEKLSNDNPSLSVWMQSLIRFVSSAARSERKCTVEQW